MPNWCYQNLQVEGPHEEINRLKEAITELGKENKETYSLNKLFPIPEDLMNTQTGFISDETELAKQKEQHIQNMVNHGSTDWYGWALDNWGSKWGAGSIELQDFGVSLLNTPMSYLNLSFESAWSPASQLICEISKSYPKSIFGLTFSEESDAFVGGMAINGGQVLAEFNADLDSDDRPDWELNDGEDFSDWMHNKVWECDEQLDKFIAEFNSATR